jgi:hypothetical protein
MSSNRPVEEVVAAINERTIHMQTDIGDVREYLRKQNGQILRQGEKVHNIEVCIAEHLKGHEATQKDIEGVKEEVRRPLVRVLAVLAALQVIVAVLVIWEKIT